MRWPWSRRAAPRAYAPVADTLAAYFTPAGLIDLSGVRVTEATALGLSSLFRAVTLISGTLASLPLRTMRATDLAGSREVVPSIFDNPDGDDGQTPFEWKESLFLHALIHGAAYALKVRNDGGGLVRLPLLHPLTVRVEPPSQQDYKRGTLPRGGKWFRVNLADGTQKRLDAEDVWHMPAISSDGIDGMGLLQLARQSIATGIAGDKAAGNMFANGALISGLATPDSEDDITDDVPEIRRQLNRSVSGHENAGAIAVVNRRLKFTPWTMTAVDAQFLQSRQFQIEEISRWTGVPPHLLMQTEKQTSWGTGVDEQNRALGRTVLNPWSTRFEQRASRLLAKPRWVEVDFTALERPAPDREAETDLKQVAAGVMTVAEYRAKRGWEPLPAAETGGTDAPPAE